jgi:hypothetical protein
MLSAVATCVPFILRDVSAPEVAEALDTLFAGRMPFQE